MNAPPARPLRSWIVRATSSFPVPFSPRMQTRVSLAATRSICAITRCMAAPCHTISCLPSRCLSCRFSLSSRCSFSAFSTVSKSFSVEIGFSRKSKAPRRVARTAISMSACPDIITTGAVTPCAFNSSSSAKPPLPGITTSERMRSKLCALASCSALSALSHTVASCPASRNARDSDASVFASSSTISRCAFVGNRPPESKCYSAAVHRIHSLGQLDHKSRSASQLALYADSSSMIAHHRLHNGQSQAGAMLFVRIIRSKYLFTLFPRQPRTSIRNVYQHVSVIISSSQRQRSSLRHRVHRVKHKISNCLVQQLRVCPHRFKVRIKLQFTTDLRTSRRLQLRLTKLHHAPHHLIHLHLPQLWLRHLRKLAEPSNNSLEIRDLRQQRSRTLAEDFIKLLRILLPRPHQILHCKLQRKQGVLQFMRQAPRQLSPSGHSFGLHQTFLLPEQLGGHAIERICQLPQFIVAQDIHPRIPISCRDFLRSVRQLFDWTCHPRRRPTAQQDRQQYPSTSRHQRRRPDMPNQLHIGSARVSDQKDCQQRPILALAPSLQWDGVKHFILRLIPRPLHGPSHFLFGLPHRIDQRLQFSGGPHILRRSGGVHQKLRRETLCSILIQQGPHAYWHIESGQKRRIQTAPAHHINRTLPHPRSPYRAQSHRSSFLQCFLLQKCSLINRRRKTADCNLQISELGGPLRGRDNGPIVFHKLKKIETATLRIRLRRLKIRTRIRRRAVQGHGHATGGFRTGNGLDPPHHVLALPVELAAKLSHQRRCSFILTMIECPPRHLRYQ